MSAVSCRVCNNFLVYFQVRKCLSSVVYRFIELRWNFLKRRQDNEQFCAVWNCLKKKKSIFSDRPYSLSLPYLISRFSKNYSIWHSNQLPGNTVTVHGASSEVLYCVEVVYSRPRTDKRWCSCVCSLQTLRSRNPQASTQARARVTIALHGFQRLRKRDETELQTERERERVL